MALCVPGYLRPQAQVISGSILLCLMLCSGFIQVKTPVYFVWLKKVRPLCLPEYCVMLPGASCSHLGLIACSSSSSCLQSSLQDL